MKLALILGFCMALASASLEWSWEHDLETGVNHCQISSRKVKTLDNVKLPINLPNCYTVLLKDCSSDPKFVVMMRKLSQNTEMKEIKILTKTHKIVLTPSTHDNRMRVIVNGQERPMMNQELILTVNGYPLRITKEGHQQVKIQSMRTGLKLRFDGHVCDIKLPEVTRQVMPLCGLCKPMTTMEHTSEFLTMRDARHLFVKYITSDCRYNKFQTTEDEECNGFFCPNKHMTMTPFWTEHDDETCTDDMYTTPYEKFSRLFTDKTFHHTPRMFTEELFHQTPRMFTEEMMYHQTPRMFTEETMYHQTPKMFTEELFHRTPRMFDDEEIFGENTMDDFTGKHDYTTFGKRVLLKHKIVEKGDEICVSMVRIPQCPVTTVPEMKVEKRVPYTCVYRNDPRVMKYHTRILNGERIPEILRSTPTMTRTEVIPVKCTPLY